MARGGGGCLSTSNPRGVLGGVAGNERWGGGTASPVAKLFHGREEWRIMGDKGKGEIEGGLKGGSTCVWRVSRFQPSTMATPGKEARTGQTVKAEDYGGADTSAE